LIGESISRFGASAEEEFDTNKDFNPVQIRTISSGRGAAIETCRRIIPIAPMNISTSGVSTGQAF
jgi:hypothetical protein